MSNGDILAELRDWRDNFALSHGYDLGAMVEVLQELDRLAGARVIRGTPRRPVTVLPRGIREPNQVLQQPGHANDGSSEFNAKPT
jgi:hypothetical protein